MKRALLLAWGLALLPGCNLAGALGLGPVLRCETTDDCNNVWQTNRACIDGECIDVANTGCAWGNRCITNGACCTDDVGSGLLCDDHEWVVVDDPATCPGRRDGGSATDGGATTDAGPGRDAGVGPDANDPADAGDAGDDLDAGRPDVAGDLDAGDADVIGDLDAAAPDVLVPPACTTLTLDGRAVAACPGPVDFATAQTDCQQAGLDLLVVPDHESYRALLETAAVQQAWIGLRREGAPDAAFAWVDGTPANFLMWNPGQPDMTTLSACAVYNPEDGLGFSDRDCGAAYPYFCAAPNHPVQTVGTFTDPSPALFPQGCQIVDAAFGRAYAYCTTGVTAGQAAATCSAAEGQLVELRSAAEGQFFVDQLPGINNVFIALSDVGGGSFVWPDGTLLGTYAPWGVGEPDIESGQACVVAALNNERWSTDDCDLPEAFVCESRFVPD